MKSTKQNILILGATSAMAQETARCFALQENVHFILVARSPDKLTAFAEDLKARGSSEVTTMSGDLIDEAFHSKVIADTFQKVECLDIVLMAWGDLGEEEKAQEEFAAAQHILNVNFNSYVSVLTKLIIPFEKQKKGTIAVITSVAGDRGRRPNYTYGSAKAGLSAFLQGYRSRLFDSGVKVLNIKPGPVSTPMTAHMEQGPIFAKADKVGEDIYRGILKGRDEIYTPSFWRVIMLVIGNIPEVIFKRLNI